MSEPFRSMCMATIKPAPRWPTLVYSREFDSRDNANLSQKLDTGEIGHPSPDQLRFGLPNQNSDDLVFDSNFEGGNLQSATRVGTYEYELSLSPDPKIGCTQWFYFSVTNLRRGSQYHLKISNMTKQDSLFSRGQQPLMLSSVLSRKEGKSWQRTGTDVRYTKNSKKRDGVSHYTLSFRVEFPIGNDKCFIAYCYPYTYTDLQKYMKCLKARCEVLRCADFDILCKTTSGRPVPIVTVTSPDVSQADIRRKGIFISARVHPGESNASWVIQGLLDFLVSDADEARTLRSTYVFFIIPMLNPDGCSNGTYRCDNLGFDLNRHWNEPDEDLHPTIFHAKKALATFCAGMEVDFFFDIHGHSARCNAFLYGCDMRYLSPKGPDGLSSNEIGEEKLFAQMLQDNSTAFSLRDSTFLVKREKENTARVVAWRELGIVKSYTMEVSLGGTADDNGVLSQFSRTDFEGLGRSLGMAFLNYSKRNDKGAQEYLEFASGEASESFSDQSNESNCDEPEHLTGEITGKPAIAPSPLPEVLQFRSEGLGTDDPHTYEEAACVLDTCVSLGSCDPKEIAVSPSYTTAMGEVQASDQRTDFSCISHDDVVSDQQEDVICCADYEIETAPAPDSHAVRRWMSDLGVSSNVHISSSHASPRDRQISRKDSKDSISNNVAIPIVSPPSGNGRDWTLWTVINRLQHFEGCQHIHERPHNPHNERDFSPERSTNTDKVKSRKQACKSQKARNSLFVQTEDFTHEKDRSSSSDDNSESLELPVVIRAEAGKYPAYSHDWTLNLPAPPAFVSRPKKTSTSTSIWINQGPNANGLSIRPRRSASRKETILPEISSSHIASKAVSEQAKLPTLISSPTSQSSLRTAFPIRSKVIEDDSERSSTAFVEGMVSPRCLDCQWPDRPNHSPRRPINAGPARRFFSPRNIEVGEPQAERRKLDQSTRSTYQNVDSEGKAVGAGAKFLPFMLGRASRGK